MKVFLGLLIVSLTTGLYCEEAEEPSKAAVDFAQKYETVFGEIPSNEIWVRKGKGAPPPPGCMCCSNIY